MNADTQAAPEGQFVQANGLDIYYEEAGAGTPLILLHGGTGIGSSWRPHLPPLAAHFRVIMPDSRGHGRTNNPSGTLSYRAMADDFAAFAQALKLNKPLFFGYSDGGQTCLEIGLRHPDLAGGLVIGAATYQFTPTYFAAVSGFMHIRDGAVDVAALEQSNPDWAAGLRADHAQPGDPDHWKTLFAQIGPMWLTPLDFALADLHGITAPCLVLAGDRDNIVSVEQAVEMYRALPQGGLAILPYATHLSAVWGAAGPNSLLTQAVLPFLLQCAAPAG